jgi:hypothetical protein
LSSKMVCLSKTQAQHLCQLKEPARLACRRPAVNESIVFTSNNLVEVFGVPFFPSLQILSPALDVYRPHATAGLSASSLGCPSSERHGHTSSSQLLGHMRGLRPSSTLLACVPGARWLCDRLQGRVWSDQGARWRAAGRIRGLRIW